MAFRYGSSTTASLDMLLRGRSRKPRVSSCNCIGGSSVPVSSFVATSGRKAKGRKGESRHPGCSATNCAHPTAR